MYRYIRCNLSQVCRQNRFQLCVYIYIDRRVEVVRSQMGVSAGAGPIDAFCCIIQSGIFYIHIRIMVCTYIYIHIEHITNSSSQSSNHIRNFPSASFTTEKKKRNKKTKKKKKRKSKHQNVIKF